MAPMTMSDLRERRDEIMQVARARGATRVRVFGSVARGGATEGSDLDFLVDLEPGRSLLDLGGLLMDLQDLLQRAVDGGAVTVPNLVPARRRQRRLHLTIVNTLRAGFLAVHPGTTLRSRRRRSTGPPAAGFS